MRPSRDTYVRDRQSRRKSLPISVTLERQASGVETDVSCGQLRRKPELIFESPLPFVRLMGPVGQFDPVQALMSKVVICVGGADVGGAGVEAGVLGADVGGGGAGGVAGVAGPEVDEIFITRSAPKGIVHMAAPS